jgi:aspartyl-tRNA(Asn)/glutamyl-tRNA(Gln) amidotransferase subunit B
MNFEPTIGIEIHVELKTDSKMFSPAPCSFGKAPNSQTVPYDLGCPGTMPIVNKQAVVDGIRIASALHMTIEKKIQFDRKNYFYTDLPKGYQITQQEHPIGSKGYLDIETNGQVRRIRIERAHLEEDTAKQLHLGDMTLVDYNRCGTPLVEIVSMPDITDPEEAMKYVEAIREIVTFLDVSDGKMEEGSMRCDVNISIKPIGSKTLGTKVEIKNLNSIANVKAALEYEIKRQTEVILSGEQVRQETRRYDESKKETSLMRVKSNAIDYKYFREPNIVPILISDEFVDNAIKTMHKLPSQYKEELLSKGLTSKEAEVLLASRDLVDYFDDVSSKGTKDLKTLWNYLMGDITAYLNKDMLPLTALKFTPEDLKDFCNLVSEGKINSKQAKQVMELMLKDGSKPNKIVKDLGLEQVSDTGAIEALVDQVLKDNQQSVADFKAGHDHALGYIVGQVMKASHGKANPGMAKEMILKKINAK